MLKITWAYTLHFIFLPVMALFLPSTIKGEFFFLEISLKSTKNKGMIMRLVKYFLIFSIGLLVIASAAEANDFDWTKNLNIQAQADLSGFKARLATRFKIGDVQVDAVLNNVGDPADAYLALRLGEMSGRPVDQVIEKYKKYGGKGWGALAKSLGIKPGSQEFHALKQGHDLNDRTSKSKNYYVSFDQGPDKRSGNLRGKAKRKN